MPRPACTCPLRDYDPGCPRHGAQVEDRLLDAFPPARPGWAAKLAEQIEADYRA